jgi:hypothetical protein
LTAAEVGEPPQPRDASAAGAAAVREQRAVLRGRQRAEGAIERRGDNATDTASSVSLPERAPGTTAAQLLAGFAGSAPDIFM